MGRIDAHIKQLEGEKKYLEEDKTHLLTPASLIEEDTDEKVNTDTEVPFASLASWLEATPKKTPSKAKAQPSSFAQTSENPDDGFAKVEAKLKALQEKIK